MTSRTLRLAYRLLRTAALEDRIALLARKYPKVPEEDIRKLATIDPTGGKYLEWLVRNYEGISPSMDRMDSWSITSIREMLVFYDKVKKSQVLLDRMDLSPDINQVDISHLQHVWFKNRGIDLVSERQKTEKAKKLGARVIYDKNGYKVVEISGDQEYAPLAACLYARGTKWCTSDKEKAWSYLRQRPLYVLFKDEQKILQTDLRDWTDVADKDINIMNNDELSRVMVDSGLLRDPDKILWVIRHSYFSGAPGWPAVEPVLAQDPKSAYAYATATGKRFELGEPAIALDPGLAFQYAVLILHDRFPEAEETIMASPDWSTAYRAYTKDLQNKREQKQEISSSRDLRLAYRLLRTAALEDRIRYYEKTQGIPEETIRKLATADPTGGKYLGWLIKNITDPDAFPDHWFGRVRQVLSWYSTVSKSKILLEYTGLDGDINKLTLDQVYNSWVDHREEDLQSKAQRAKQVKKTAKVIYSDGTYKVLQIGGEGVDPEAAVETACAYSQGTAWCTRGIKEAKKYLERGPLLLAFKGSKRLFLANWRGNEIKDEQNKDIDITEEILFLLLKSGILQLWASQDRASSDKDPFFNYLVYSMGIYPHKYPELLQYMMDHRLVSQERMARYMEVVGGRLPNVDTYIATDPEAALIYAKYVLGEPWPEGEPAIRSVPEYWKNYQHYFREELVHA